VDIYIKFLPMESATVTAMRTMLLDSGEELPKGDPGGGSWSMAEMLIAQVVDELRYLQYTTVQVNSEKKTGQPPEPIPRPGTVKKRKRTQRMSREDAMKLDPRLRGGGNGNG
jgi:hypothetical protein